MEKVNARLLFLSFSCYDSIPFCLTSFEFEMYSKYMSMICNYDYEI